MVVKKFEMVLVDTYLLVLGAILVGHLLPFSSGERALESGVPDDLLCHLWCDVM